jgi:hypothetical protein
LRAEKKPYDNIRHGYFGRTHFEEDLKPTWDESLQRG